MERHSSLVLFHHWVGIVIIITIVTVTATSPTTIRLLEKKKTATMAAMI